MDWYSPTEGILYDPYMNIWRQLQDGTWYSEVYGRTYVDPRQLTLPPPDVMQQLQQDASWDGLRKQLEALGYTPDQVQGTLEAVRQSAAADTDWDSIIMAATSLLMGNMAGFSVLKGATDLGSQLLGSADALTAGAGVGGGLDTGASVNDVTPYDADLGAFNEGPVNPPTNTLEQALEPAPTAPAPAPTPTPEPTPTPTTGSGPTLGQIGTGAALATTAASLLNSGGTSYPSFGDNSYSTGVLDNTLTAGGTGTIQTDAGTLLPTGSDTSLTTTYPDSYSFLPPLGSGSGGGVLAPDLGYGTGPATSPNDPLLKQIAQQLGVTPESLLRMIGAGGASLLGAYASKQQADAFKEMYDKYLGMGEPYRNRLSSLYADPGSFLKSPEVQIPTQQGTDQLMKSLSVTSGNPWGNPNALQKAQDWTSNTLFSRLGEEKDRLAGFGGLSSYSGAAPSVGGAAINANSNIYNSIGSGIANIFNPPKTAAQTLAEFRTLMNAGVG